MASFKFFAQYASNQLECVACGDPIRPNVLILGLVHKNSVGFEEPKWHHWGCIPVSSVPIDSVEGVDGFYSLKSFDQSRLKLLLTYGANADEVAGDELERSNPKKPKTSDQERLKDLTDKRKGQDGIEGSDEKSSKKSKFVTENAKSNRSTYKKCGDTLSEKALRFGLVSKNSRGFDTTNWHYLKCFPLDSEPIVSVANIDGLSFILPKKGVSSLENNDQEALKNLIAECGHFPKENEIEGSDKKSSKFVAEYAKSNRSTCKICIKAIAAKELRLGLVVKNSVRFETKYWHHLECFPLDTEPIYSVENIDGFSSLERSDQERLKDLTARCDLLPKEISNLEKLKNLIAGCNHLPKENEIEGSDKKSSKVSKATEVAVDECDGNNTKKPKDRKTDEVAVSELEGSTSMKPKIVAEYSMSNRSTCKQCEKPILAKVLRLGLVSKNSEGLDATNWHHLECFPFDTVPIDSVKNIKGFSSPKITDQKDLKNWKGNGKKGSKVSKANEVAEDECEGSNSKKPKSQTSASFKEAKPEFVYSVCDVNNYYKDALLRPNWKAFRSIIFLEQERCLHGSAKIAAFGFEGCLLDTLRSANAGSLLYMSIPAKLKSLFADGYKLVIFINEPEIESWKNERQTAVNCILERVDNFISHVDVPIQVFVACGIDKTEGQTEDPFSKPKTGMWTIMEQQFNSDTKIDIDQSFYVGNWRTNDTDKGFAEVGFAEAIGLKKFLPEDYFDT